MRLLPLCLLAGCHLPDRWNAAVTRDRGELDNSGLRDGDRDFDSTAFTVGVSGDLILGSPRKPQERTASTEAAAVDLQPVLDALDRVQASIEAQGKKEGKEPPGAVETGATQAAVLASAGGVVLALLKGIPWGWAKWKARGA